MRIIVSDPTIVKVRTRPHLQPNNAAAYNTERVYDVINPTDLLGDEFLFAAAVDT